MLTDPNRRDFFSAAGAMLATGWWAANAPGVRAAAAHAARSVREGHLALEVLTTAEAADLAALAEQIIPSEPGAPGAREAGVTYFADRALATFAAGLTEPVRDGLAAMDRLTAEKHPGAGRFAELDPARQEALMPAVAALPVFGLLRVLVLAGMFGDPSYGGNRNQVGWRLLGFDDRFAWQPPFGYYDRDAHPAQ
jgi:gluconate 2-dehydrogenase gamma chain